MENIKLEDIQTIFETLNKSKIERKGYIMLPSIEGFQLFEISEERLKHYLQAESLHNRALAEHVHDASELTIPDVVGQSKQLKCELERWFYSCVLYNLNKGCNNCKHYKAF